MNPYCFPTVPMFSVHAFLESNVFLITKYFCSHRLLYTFTSYDSSTSAINLHTPAYAPLTRNMSFIFNRTPLLSSSTTKRSQRRSCLPPHATGSLDSCTLQTVETMRAFPIENLIEDIRGNSSIECMRSMVLKVCPGIPP
jgi:hypothetical protein